MGRKTGQKHTEETKAKMKASAKLRDPKSYRGWTDEQRKFASDQKIGVPWTAARRAKGNPMWTDERRALGGSCGMLGKKHSEETRKKMSDAAFNRSDETKARMSAASKGKPKSEAHKKAMSESAKKRIREGRWAKTYTKTQKQIEKEAKTQ